MKVSNLVSQKIYKNFKQLLRITFRLCRKFCLPIILVINRFKAKKFQKISPLKLNVGCGRVKLEGWVNIDIDYGADLIIDIRKGLPFYDDSVDFIYTEHVLEHFNFKVGGKILKEFYRCLKKGGYVRIAMPDLDYVLFKYNSQDWREQDWLTWPEYKFIKTKGQMINVSFRYWGHKYLYNEEDLKNQLIEAGFQKIIRCKIQESGHTELCNLETRKDSKLIIEAKKE